MDNIMNVPVTVNIGRAQTEDYAFCSLELQ